MTVPRSEIIELPITVEEAIRFTVSGGVLVPSGQQFQGHGPAGESGRAEPGRPEGLTPLPDPQGEAADRGPGQRRAKDEAE